MGQKHPPTTQLITVKESIFVPRLLIAVLAALGVVAPAPAVNVWLTTGDGSQLLKQQPDLVLLPGAGVGGTSINVFPATTYQTISGFGASMTDSTAWLLDNRMSETQRDKLMQQLFSPDKGVGLNYLRVPIGASDFTATNFYTYNDAPPGGSDDLQQHFTIAHDLDHIVPRLQQALALNPNLKIMASPWTAPAWMKSNNNVSGGTLLPQWEASYARYLTKFIQAYAAEDLPIDAITIQNEPLHTSNYPTMSMSATQQARLIRDHLGPLFASEDVATKILAYDHNWDNTDYPIQVLGDPGANQYIAGTAFHAYAGNVSAQTTVHNAFPDKDIYFTEITGGDWATNFADNLAWNLQNIIIGNARNWGKTAIFWNLALDQNGDPHLNGCDGCRGVVTIDKNDGSVTFNEEFYALAHATRGVQAGATRVNSTTSTAMNTVAFLNPDGSRAVVAMNTTNAAIQTRFIESGKHFRFTIPAKSAATFRWDDNGADFDNGDFDDGGFSAAGGSLDAWSVFGSTNGNVSASDEAVLTGDKSLKVYGQFNGVMNNGSGVAQSVSVSPNDLVTVSLSSFVRSIDGLAGTENFAEARIEFYSVFGAQSDSEAFISGKTLRFADSDSLPDVWSQTSLSAVAPPNAVEGRLIIQFTQPSGQTGAVHIDSVALRTVAPGDYNGDGMVDTGDYAIWRDSYGSRSALDADGNGDGVIDGADYVVWRDRWQPGIAARQVPEPCSLFPSVGALLAAVNSQSQKTLRLRYASCEKP